MRSRLALVLTPLLLLAMLPAAVSAAPAGNASTAARDRILAYWTPERAAHAVPRDFTFDAVRGFAPARGKPGGGGGGGGDGTVTGASWTGGGAILTSTGRALFTLGGIDYICSGSIVTDSNSGRSVVLTAGHCVVENDGTFATNWLFIPEFDSAPTYTCSNTKHGCWTAVALYADAAFASAGSFNLQAVTHDWGFAVVGQGGKSGTAQLDSLGSFEILYSGVTAGDTLSAFGYPAAGRYKGRDLVYCKGPIGTDAWAADATWSMGCNMTGGSSGGPWVSGADPRQYAGTVLRSLNSYGYSGVSNMYGPKFTNGTQAVFGAADALASGGVGVVRTTLP